MHWIFPITVSQYRPRKDPFKTKEDFSHDSSLRLGWSSLAPTLLRLICVLR